MTTTEELRQIRADLATIAGGIGRVAITLRTLMQIQHLDRPMLEDWMNLTNREMGEIEERLEPRSHSGVR